MAALFFYLKETSQLRSSIHACHLMRNCTHPENDDS